MTATTMAPPRASLPHKSVPDRRPLVLALCFGAAAVAISFIGSWIPSLWGDEVTSVLSAERSLPSLFRMLGHVDAVHGTYYFFLHFWIAAFGASPISVRFPSAIATGFAVAGVTALAYRMAGLRTAVLASAICLVIPRITYMGQEARSYAFSAALATWVTYLLVELVMKRSTKRRYWLLYAVGIAACAYVFLFSLLLIPAHLTFVLWARDRTILFRWVRALVGGLVLSLPILVYGIAERGQISFLTDRTAATFASVTIGQWFGNALCAIACWTLLAAALIFAAVRWRRRSRQTIELLGSRDLRLTDAGLPLLAAVWLLFPPAFLLLVNFVDPIYSSRYLTFATPAFALLVGNFLALARPRWIGPLLAITVAVTAFPTYEAQRTPYAENASDWATDAAYIGAHASPGDGILFDETINPSKRPRLAMRAYPSDFVGLKDVALKTPWWQTDNWDDAIYPLADVSSRLSGIRTVWLIEYRLAGGMPDTYDQPTLAQLGYTRVQTVQEHSSIIMEYQRP
jgi:mannosyltransferase